MKIFFGCSVQWTHLEILLLLLSIEDHAVVRGHGAREEGSADSEGQEQEPQQCSASSCSTTSSKPQFFCPVDYLATDVMALVPYNEESIPILFKPERQFTFLGRTLTISQDWGNRGVAAVVWDAAIVLCEYITKNQEIIRGRSVLELGAGTGLVSMVAALAGGKVTSTERAAALDYLQLVVSSNLNPSEHGIRVTELDWTHDHSTTESDYDILLGADIVYIKDTFPDLLRTLLHFAGPDTLVLLSCRIRYERDSDFLSMLQERFNIVKVHFDSEKDIHIYSAKRKTIAGRGEL